MKYAMKSVAPTLSALIAARKNKSLPPNATLKNVGDTIISMVCFKVYPWCTCLAPSRVELTGWILVTILITCRPKIGTHSLTLRVRVLSGARVIPHSGTPGNAFRYHSTTASVNTLIAIESHGCAIKLFLETSRATDPASFTFKNCTALRMSAYSRNKIAPSHRR